MKLNKLFYLSPRRSLIALGGLSNILLLLSLTIAMPTVSAVELIRGLGGPADVGNLAIWRSDDGSSGRKMLGAGFQHGINFFGETYDSLYINNNGNVSFKGPVYGFTPRPFPISFRPMIAPYWGDVDTRSSNVPEPTQNLVYYTALENQFFVTWYYVGYYSYRTEKLNAFQLILTDRSEIAPGDFDVEFRYEQLEWTTGNFSGGSGGLGGTPAQVGFDAGDWTHFYKHPDSMTGEILNLVNTSNVDEDGVWRFEIRSGIIVPPGNILSDVNVTVKLPVTDLDIELTSFATEPLSIEIENGETWVKWYFETFSADQVQDLGFDINLRNPIAGEERLITYVLELSYLDINGNPVYTELGPQTVTVLPSVYQLSVNTDKTTYSIEEPVDISYQISNLSTFAQEAEVQFSVQDSNGNLVADLGTQSEITLDGESNLVLTEPDFFTGTLYEGQYQVMMKMVDNTGQTVMTASTAFEMVTPQGVDMVAAVMTTDKPVYKPLETVLVKNRISNQVPNAIVDDLTAMTTIYAPDNSVFWTNETAVPQLLPAQIKDQNHSVPLGRAVPGNYHLTLVIIDALGVEKASSTTDIEVQSTAGTGFGLVGHLTATPTIVLKSELVNLSGQIENLGNATIDNLPLVLSIIDPQAELMVTQWTETVPSLIVEDQYHLAQDWEVWGEVGETYMATLGVQQADGEIQILATTSFLIADKIESTFEPGIKGRLLILLDKETSLEEPHGPQTAPTLLAQRDFLEALLEADGWTYTIVTDEAAFTRELRSGGYLVYALLSEQEKLAETVQKELREAVYRGEGLVVAGAHDQRHHLNETLGIKYLGHSPKASGFIFNDNGETLTTAFAFSDKVLRAELAGASPIGQFQLSDPNCHQTPPKNNGKGSQDNSPNCTSMETLAATFQNYGEGKSIYLGFDLLAQATALGEDSLFADVLTTTLTTVHPEALPPRIGQMMPIELTLNNQGTATSGQALIDLPDGMTIIIPDEVLFDELEARLIWPFDLQTEQSLTLTFWLRLPWVVGPVPVNGLIQIGLDPDFEDYGNLTLAIEVQAEPCLPEALDLLTALQSEDQAYAKALKHLQKAAQLIQTDENDEKALKELVQAVDELLKSDGLDAHRLRVMIDHAIRNLAGVISITQ